MHLRHKAARGWACVMVLSAVLAACGGEPEVREASEARTLPEDAVIMSGDLDLAQLPLCGANDIEDASEIRGDCAIKSADTSGLSGRVRYGDGSDMGTTSVSVMLIGADGSPLQRIDGFEENTYAVPAFTDLDADGADELLLPVMTGNVNTVYTVWRRTGEDRQFSLLGEISGVDFGPAGDGMFSVSARSSAMSYEVGYHRFAPGRIETVATALIEFVEETPDGEVTQSCSVLAGEAMGSLGLSAEDAQKRFCGE